MPIYEYKCERCEAVFEVRQKFSDEPVTVHDVCGGPVHRLLSAPAFQFKGSGWYVTDYARSGSSSAKSESKSETSSEKPAASSESKSESTAKTETKTETKSDTKT